MPRETVLSFYDRDPEMDIRPLLAGIEVPTLIAHGTEDRQVPFAAAEYLAAHIPGAQLYPFVGYGHVPLFTATQEFCDVLRRFVRTGTDRGVTFPASAGFVTGSAATTKQERQHEASRFRQVRSGRRGAGRGRRGRVELPRAGDRPGNEAVQDGHDLAEEFSRPRDRRRAPRPAHHAR